MSVTISVASLVAVAAQRTQWWGYLAAWGNIGSLLGGVAAVVLAVAAIIGGSAGLGDWRARQRADRALAEERANDIRLDRRRVLNGWTAGGVEVYGVELVRTPAAVAEAQEQLTAGQPSDYVLLRVNERPTDNAERARTLRYMIANGGYVARPPGRGEYEALLEGRSVLLDDAATASTG